VTSRMGPAWYIQSPQFCSRKNMRKGPRKLEHSSREVLPILRSSLRLSCLALFGISPCFAGWLFAQELSLQALVTPSTVVIKDGHPVTFAIHAFIEFKSLNDAFSYIESQTPRWKSSDKLDLAARQRLGRQLVHEAVESRVVSMIDERPLEVLITHTAEELGRILSNWYPVEEGITLYGATYDSTEHFWQAVKYHPDITVAQLQDLLDVIQSKDWKPWLARLDDDPDLYLPNAYAVEFLRHNLASERLQWFRHELDGHSLRADDRARMVQQRQGSPSRFSAFEEKVLWGDLADLSNLVYTLSPAGDPIKDVLAKYHFDAIYLGERKMGFISEEFRSLMIEIWKVKYLQISRFREVIANIPREIRLEHFLNDGDSPDIPIPVYVGYLNQIREMARIHHGGTESRSQ
jgi:hypothetical protein